MADPYYRPLRDGETWRWIRPFPDACYQRDLPRPGDPCIYFLMRDAEIIYVGLSINVRQRLKGHARLEWDGLYPDAVCVMFVPDEPLEPLELAWIGHLNPRFNRKGRTDGVAA